MSRMSEIAESIAVAESTRGPMSKEALLMHIGFMASDLQSIVHQNPGCLTEAQEYRLMQIRMSLESVARAGGTIKAYIEGTERSPMPSVLRAAE